MDDQRQNQAGPPEGKGYETPGRDTIIQSSSPAVPSPGETSEERLQTPKSRIGSINEVPGDANPALAETVGVEEGRLTTAEFLLAREAAEEQYPRTAGNVHPYEDQGARVTADEFRNKDSGRPNWPDDRQQDPLEYMEPPRANAPLLSEGVVEAPEGPFVANTSGRMDWAADRAGTQASEQESRSGLAPIGTDAEEDIYERREMHTPVDQSEIDRIAPGMTNVAPEEKGGEH